MADVFLNSSNFAKHTFLTLAPPSDYALNLKALIKLSKVSWTSQLSYEIHRSSFERKFDKTNFISPKRTTPKSPDRLGLSIIFSNHNLVKLQEFQTYSLENQKCHFCLLLHTLKLVKRNYACLVCFWWRSQNNMTLWHSRLYANTMDL